MNLTPKKLAYIIITAWIITSVTVVAIIYYGANTLNTPPAKIQTENIPINVYLKADATEETIRTNGFTGNVSVTFYAEVGQKYILFGRGYTTNWQEIGRFTYPAVTTNGVFEFPVKRPLKFLQLIVREER
jgi:hypothetical protein